MFNYYLILGSVLVIAIGQIIFKFAAGQLRFASSRSYYELLLDNMSPILLVTLALALYLMATIAWVQALRSVPLSVAFMFNSLAFVLVPVAGFVVFGEPIPRFFLLGLALIIGGILLVTYG